MFLNRLGGMKIGISSKKIVIDRLNDNTEVFHYYFMYAAA